MFGATERRFGLCDDDGGWEGGVGGKERGGEGERRKAISTHFQF